MTSFEESTLAALVESASGDGPTADELARLSDKLAGALPAGTLAGTAVGATATVSSHAVSWIVGAAVAVSAATGGYAVHQRENHARGHIETTSLRVEAAPPEKTSEDPSQPPRPAPPTMVEPTISVSRPAEFRSPEHPPAMREAEAALLGKAHDALRAGRYDEALTLCRRHEVQHPQGLLSQEREVIVIETLIAREQWPLARARADAFRAKYPASSHLARIARLLADREESP